MFLFVCFSCIICYYPCQSEFHQIALEASKLPYTFRTLDFFAIKMAAAVRLNRRFLQELANLSSTSKQKTDKSQWWYLGKRDNHYFGSDIFTTLNNSSSTFCAKHVGEFFLLFFAFCFLKIIRYGCAKWWSIETVTK